MKFEVSSNCPIKQIELGHRLGAFLARDYELGIVSTHEVTQNQIRAMNELSEGEGALVERCIDRRRAGLCHPVPTEL